MSRQLNQVVPVFAAFYKFTARPKDFGCCARRHSGGERTMARQRLFMENIRCFVRPTFDVVMDNFAGFCVCLDPCRTNLPEGKVASATSKGYGLAN